MSEVQARSSKVLRYSFNESTALRDCADLTVLYRLLEPDAPSLTPEKLRNIAREHLFVARNEHRVIVGMALLTLTWHFSGRIGHVHTVVVAGSCRGEGIGRALMERLIAFARYEGASELELTSSDEKIAAHALYKSLGFRLRETNVYNLAL